jgi:predicted Fe-S protein YdhL (DUF1289 family)
MTQSPCIKICELDDDAICLGCYRSASEIGDWWQADPAQQLEIMANARQRQQAYAARHRNKGLTSSTTTTSK